MRIHKPELIERNGLVSYRVLVESSAGATELWFSVSRAFGHLLSERSEAALLGLLVPAMRRGEDIQVTGSISPRMIYNTTGALQCVLKHIIPSLTRVRICADRMEEVSSRAAGVATGFSGGIDSFTVLADHLYGDPPPGLRVTHLLHNNVGSHGRAGETLFRARYERLRPMAERLNLPFIAVDSNLPDFYEGLTFRQTYTVRNAAVAHLLQRGIGRSLHAAGTVYSTTRIQPEKDIAFADPVILPLMSTEALDAFEVGGMYSRIEKTSKVAEIEDSYFALDVCVGGLRAGNCSACRKCVRTMWTMEMLGVLDRYSQVFDVQVYRKVRHWHIARILRLRKLFAVELRALARDSGFRIPLSWWFLAWTWMDLAHKKLPPFKRAFSAKMEKVSRTIRDLIPSRPRTRR